MPDAIHTQIATELPAVQEDSARSGLPADIQYMPPGRHTINATRNKEPITIDITADQSAAENLNAWLQDRLQSAAAGTDDRPFFDFNHEDREAAAWPTEFYWAGDDPITGGIRAKVEWTGAGAKAIHERTFRRFSPTFIPDADGKVIASETNMGGLVNRAAFKTIQPLFAKDSHNKEAVAANWSDEARAASLKVRRQKAAERAGFEQASRERQGRIARNDRRPGETQTERDTRVARDRTRSDTDAARRRTQQNEHERTRQHNDRFRSNPVAATPIERAVIREANQFRRELESMSRDAMLRGEPPISKVSIERAVIQMRNELRDQATRDLDTSSQQDIQRQADIWTERWNTARDRSNRQVGIRPVRSKNNQPLNKKFPISANWSDEARAASLKVRRENARRRAEERLRKQAEWQAENRSRVADTFRNFVSPDNTVKDNIIKPAVALFNRYNAHLEKRGNPIHKEKIHNIFNPPSGFQQADLDYFGFDDTQRGPLEQRAKDFARRVLNHGLPAEDQSLDWQDRRQPNPRKYTKRIAEMSTWAENYDTARSKNETNLPEPPAWAVERFRERNPNQFQSNDPLLDSQLLKDNLLNDYYQQFSPERESELRLWAIRNGQSLN